MHYMQVIVVLMIIGKLIENGQGMRCNGEYYMCSMIERYTPGFVLIIIGGYNNNNNYCERDGYRLGSRTKSIIHYFHTSVSATHILNPIGLNNATTTHPQSQLCRIRRLTRPPASRVFCARRLCLYAYNYYTGPMFVWDDVFYLGGLYSLNSVCVVLS